MALKTAIHWIRNLSWKHEYEYIFSVDSSDPQLAAYSGFGSVEELKGCKIVVSDNKNLVEASNAGAKQASGDIFVLISDDFLCYKDWDLRVVDAFQGRIPGQVLKTFDGVQKWIVTLPIMDRAYYERCGYFYNPAFSHMFVDTYMTHRADIEGRLIMRNDLYFRHAHYSTGENQKDAVSIKADATWDQGEKAYFEGINELESQGLDIWAISPEGIHHKNWLKAKLK